MIPDARLLVYPGAGHTFYYKEPERVAADLAAFVADVARSSVTRYRTDPRRLDDATNTENGFSQLPSN